MKDVFFCHTHIVDLPIEQQSPDPRYCQGCYDFLLEEAKLLGVKRVDWIPKIPKRKNRGSVVAIKAPDKPLDAPKPVSKLPDPIIPQVGVFKHSGGRPKKLVGGSRVTRWRREKEKQGVLI